MCCIFIKPAGRTMPSTDILNAICDKNPHGFGFATPTRYMRTMDKKEFIRALQEVGDEEPCIAHARFATHGSLRETNCHPFYDDGTNTYFMHNGVLPFSPKGDISDSEYAFRRMIVPVIKRYGYATRQVGIAVNRIIGTSKFAMLNGDDICMFGHYHNVDGIYYSNLYFIGNMRKPLAMYSLAV